MIVKVVLLESAERDLKDLRKYLVQRFSAAEWTAAFKQIRLTLRTLAQFHNQDTLWIFYTNRHFNGSCNRWQE